MKRVLITGVSGFIGNSLKEFIEGNLPSFEVYGIDSALSKSTKRYFKRDLNDQKSIKTIIEKISPIYIFHLAGLTNKKDHRKLISANILPTYNLLDSLLDLKNIKTRVIIPGSAAEYGRVSQEDMPVKESYPLKPVNLYGFVKMYQTLLALSFCEKGLDIVVGRAFNIMGWGSSNKLVIGRFADQISLIEKGKKKTTINTESLGSKRDFLDIQDVCSAFMAIANRGKSGEVYNICSGKLKRVGGLLDSLVKMSNCPKVAIRSSCVSSPNIKSISGSNRKIKKDTGWSPKAKIHESLKNTLDYYRRKNGR